MTSTARELAPQQAAQTSGPIINQGNTIFSDNFESYPVGAANPCMGPPQSASNCLGPPDLNIGSTTLPQYYRVASGNACLLQTPTDCVTWVDNPDMDPNSIVAVVRNEQYTSCCQSLKIGIGDLGHPAVTKTTAVVLVPSSLIPSGAIVTWKFSLWLSHGVDIGNFLILDFGGVRFQYNHGGVLGSWSITDGNGNPVLALSSDYLTTQAWHTIQFTFNTATNTFYSAGAVLIDGTDAFPTIDGQPIPSGSASFGGGSTLFGIWLMPIVNNDSLKTAGPTNGYYAYVDDWNIMLGAGSGTTSTPTTSATSGSTSSTSVITAMNEMANWQITALGSSQNAEDWSTATFYDGLAALYQTTGSTTYLNDLTSWGNANSWTPITPYSNPDNFNAGQAFIDTYILQGSSTSSEFAPTQSAVTTAMSGSNTWTYEDALFMAPPTFARVGYASGTSSYFSSIDTWYWQSVSALQDPTTKLLWRDSTFIGQTCPNGQKMLWSRGNAWVMAGLVRILQYLPKSDPSYSQYVSLLQTMAAAVAPFQESSGYWPSCLTDPTDYPEPETSGTAGFVYAMAWGINNGLLDAATYMPIVQSGWNALVNAIQPNGALGWVQPTGTQPGSSTASDSYSYGTGLALLAGSEVAKMNGVTNSMSSYPSSSTSSTSSIPPGTIIMDENFETGNHTYGTTYNYELCQNGVDGYSSLNPPTNGAIVHSGNYAGYYYGGPPVDPSGRSCREYPQFGPSFPPLTDFYWEMWVYVPNSYPNTGWVSFATFDGGDWVPFGLDATANGYFDSDIVGSGLVTMSSTQFPLNQWFKLSLIAHGVGSNDASLVYYFNDVEMIQVTGVKVADGPLVQGHFGLYKQSTVGDYALYNDDILIETLSSSSGTTTTATSSQTSTTSNTSETTSTWTSTMTSAGTTSTQTVTQTSTPSSATPSITLSPASATAGSTVSVSGSGFSASDTSCSLSGAAVGTSTCSVSGGSLVATFLVADVGAGSYTITASGSPGADSATVNFQVLTSGPSITLSPASASVGSTVTVSGSGFSTDDTSCSFSGTPVESASCLISGGALTGSFVVANEGGGSYTIAAMGSPASDSASATLSLLQPSITLNPSAAEPGATVTVSGSGFYTTDTTCSLVGGGVAAQSCSISAGSLTGSFTVANAPSGTYLITVMTSGADSDLATAYLQVSNAVTNALTTTTSTLLGTSTATQFSATTTTFTLTGVSTTESATSVTVTVMGQTTSSVATASTITAFVTAASTTTQTEITTTTHNLLTGVIIAPSLNAGGTDEDTVGLLTALLMLLWMVLRKRPD
jgi:rhamnogalacturonyl hydrolase YesR